MNAILSDAFDIEKINEGIAFGSSEIISKTEAEIDATEFAQALYARGV